MIFLIFLFFSDNNNDVENRSHSENVRHLTKDTKMNRQNHTDVSKDTEVNFFIKKFGVSFNYYCLSVLFGC